MLAILMRNGFMTLEALQATMDNMETEALHNTLIKIQDSRSNHANIRGEAQTMVVGKDFAEDMACY